MDTHDSPKPAQTDQPDLPARVPRRYAEPSGTSAPAAKRKLKPPEVKAWDKLLLIVGVAVAVAALLIVPGILNRGGQNPVAEAAQATMDSPGVRMTFTGVIQGGPVQMTMNGSGVMNGETHRAAFSVSASGGAAGQTQSFQMDEMVDDLDVYIHAPAVTGGLGTTKSWILMRAGALGDLAQSGGAGMSGGISSQSSPRELLDALQSASDNVAEVGHEQLDGVDTTHYSADIDLQKALEAGGASDSVSAAIATLHPTGTVDVWVDAQGLLRRERADFTIGNVGTFTMTIDFSHYGIHPQIDVPPESEVYDMTQVVQGQLQQALHD